jgi:hypothetical protein
MGRVDDMGYDFWETIEGLNTQEGVITCLLTRSNEIWDVRRSGWG